MARVSIVTPWHNCPELIPTYEKSNVGAELVIVDNASEHETGKALHAMTMRNKGVYIYNPVNRPFSYANNQGAKLATHDVIVFMNNDIEAPAGWLDGLEDEVQPGALYGPRILARDVAGHHIPYVEGFCVAAHRQTWHELGWWDADAYPGPYWEDVDLSWRAARMGIRLVATNWNIWHFANYTSSRTPGAYAHSGANLETLTRRVAHATA